MTEQIANARTHDLGIIFIGLARHNVCSVLESQDDAGRDRDIFGNMLFAGEVYFVGHNDTTIYADASKCNGNMIKRVTFQNRKAHLRFENGVYVGYQIDVRDNGKRRRNVFATKREAQDFIDALRTKKVYGGAGMKSPETANVITLKDLIAERLKTRTTRKQKEFEKRVLNYFQDIAGEYTPVTDITLAHLKTFVEKRLHDLTVRNETVKPQTVDRELVAVAAMLHAAPEYFDELESYTAPRVPHPKYRTGRRERVVTEDERKALLAALYDKYPDLGRIFEFASLTGLRHSEIMKLRTSDLDVKARSLKVYRSKTDSVSYISPLTDRMLELLDAPSGYIFTKDGKTPSTFYRYLQRACESVGIEYGRFKADGVILHDLRHSFITRLAQAGVDIATIQSFSGHSDKTLVMRYSHAGPESRKRAMAVVDGKGKNWREVFDKVRDGSMTFEAFLEVVN